MKPLALFVCVFVIFAISSCFGHLYGHNALQTGISASKDVSVQQTVQHGARGIGSSYLNPLGTFGNAGHLYGANAVQTGISASKDVSVQGSIQHGAGVGLF